MVRITCPCGKKLSLAKMPARPFVQCQHCNRRLPVKREVNEFMDRCHKCGRILEKDVLRIHESVCTGEPAPVSK